MITIPTPVLSSIGVRKLSVKPPFKGHCYESFCNNCTWTSFIYNTEDEAVDRAESHAERCCKRINELRALQVEVTPVAVQDLEYGAHILLRDLRVMQVENIEVFDDEVMITYNIEGLESQILVLPLGHIVKTVV